jgi:hypothetical protein
MGTHDETLSVAMRVHDPDCPSFKIESRDQAQAETGFVEIVGNDLPILHAQSDGRLLIVLSHLRYGFVQFKLCADFL